MTLPRHTLAQSKTFRWVVCPLLLTLSLFWLLLTFRWISLPFLVAVLVLWLTLPWHGRARRLIIAWGLFVASTFLPASNPSGCSCGAAAPASSHMTTSRNTV